MSRHSKNNCSRAVFSYHERHRVSEYGTQQKRLSRDSQKEAEACCLCLKPVRTPLACPKGHLFCKECIYDSLFAQKKEMDRQLAAWEEQQKTLALEAERQRLKEEETKILNFTQTEGSILPPSASNTSPSSTQAVGAIVVPRKPEEHSAIITNAANKVHDSKQLRAYWLPSLTPDAGPSQVAKPTGETKCPMGHSLRLKQLIKVDFTPLKGVDIADDTKFGRFMCATCMRGLNSVSGLVLLKPCGHVVCKACHQKFSKPAGTTSGETSASPATCCVCNVKLLTDKDVIQLQASGSSFSAGGGEDKVAKKETVSARYG